MIPKTSTYRKCVPYLSNQIYGGIPSRRGGLDSIVAGVATQLVITGQPSNTVNTSTIKTSGSGSLTVQVQDGFGNPVPGIWCIVCQIGNNANYGSISGTIIVLTTNGIATFSTIKINNPGNGYTLNFSCESMTNGSKLTASITSNTFNITGTAPGTIRQVTSTGNPTNDGNALATIVNSTAVTGDTVVVGPGVFDCSGTGANVELSSASGVNILGSGQSQTTILVFGNEPGLALKSNSCYANFTCGIDNTGSIGIQGATASTSIIALNLTITGYQDAFLFGNNSTMQIAFCNCSTTGDVFNLNTSTAGGSAIIAYPNHITADPSSYSPMRAACLGLSGTVTIYGGSLNTTSSSSTNYGAYSGSKTSGMSLYGTSIYSASGGVEGTDLYTFQSNGTISEYGCTYLTTSNASGKLNLNDSLVITSGGTVAGGAHTYSVPTITVAFQSGGTTQTNNSAGQMQAFLVNNSGNTVGFASGTLTQTASSGVCTFNNLTISTPGTYQIVFAQLGMPLVYTNTFTIT